MNIGCAELEGVVDEEGDELDDRGVVFAVACGRRGFPGVRVFVGLHDFEVGSVDAADVGVHGAVESAVAGFEDLLDLVDGGDDSLHIAFQQVAQSVDGLHVGRVGHGDGQDVVVEHDRDDLILPGCFGGELRQDLVWDDERRKVDGLEPVLLGEHVGDFLFIDVMQEFQSVEDIQFAVGFGDFFPAFIYLLLGDKSIFLEQFQYIIAVKHVQTSVLWGEK